MTMVAERKPAALVGSAEPRLWTKPLRPLTRETSFGYDVIDFARDVLGITLFPWQEFLLIHAGELLPNGRNRFKKILVCVSRQNGKTEVLWVLGLFWLYVDRVQLVLGTSTNLSTAKESWLKAVKSAENTPYLARDITDVRRTNGEQELTIAGSGRYKIAASNRESARGLTVDRLILDELREHHSYEAYDAAVPTTIAVRDSQVWMLSNAGDDRSVVLNEIRDLAIAGDDELAIFEWSAPTDDPTDIENLLAANPSIGHRIEITTLLADARRAKAAGGEQLTGFITEHLCRRVAQLNPAIELEAWAQCRAEGGLDGLRDKTAMCLDVSLDEMHATLYAAAVDGERVRIDAVQAWDGRDAIRLMTAELPSVIERTKPRVLGWFPSGPAAVAAAAIIERPGWPPQGVTLEAIRGDVTAVCMGFAEQVRSLAIAHGDDPLLDAHVRAAEKLYYGDGWRFTRKGAGQVDAAYAAAGATHLARTLPDDTGGGFFT